MKNKPTDPNCLICIHARGYADVETAVDEIGIQAAARACGLTVEAIERHLRLCVPARRYQEAVQGGGNVRPIRAGAASAPVPVPPENEPVALVLSRLQAACQAALATAEGVRDVAAMAREIRANLELRAKLEGLIVQPAKAPEGADPLSALSPERQVSLLEQALDAARAAGGKK